MAGEFLVDSPQLRAFITDAQAIVGQAKSVRTALGALRPRFSTLLADQTWLPERFRHPDPHSGMGSGIATWLIFRAEDARLSLFALVVPPGASTPVHDHLAWGLVGLYVGEQDEEVYEPVGDHLHDTYQPLRLIATNHLRAGDFYELIPPAGDIHRVTTTSAMPSVSLHLLGNDAGCVWRHRFEPETGAVHAFRSGYANRPCDV